jgi:hypothetical protein
MFFFDIEQKHLYIGLAQTLGLEPILYCTDIVPDFDSFWLILKSGLRCQKSRKYDIEL